MKILLVEDEVATANFIKDGLKSQFGYSVFHLDSGEDALYEAIHGQYDLMILDLMIPPLDGMTILREARKADRKELVIILSARSQLTSKLEGLESGADDYLTKPFSPLELQARIKTICRRMEKTDVL